MYRQKTVLSLTSLLSIFLGLGQAFIDMFFIYLCIYNIAEQNEMQHLLIFFHLKMFPDTFILLISPSTFKEEKRSQKTSFQSASAWNSAWKYLLQRCTVYVSHHHPSTSKCSWTSNGYRCLKGKLGTYSSERNLKPTYILGFSIQYTESVHMLRRWSGIASILSRNV